MSILSPEDLYEFDPLGIDDIPVTAGVREEDPNKHNDATYQGYLADDIYAGGTYEDWNQELP